MAINNPKLTSYDFADAILRKLARKEIFPNLKIIVVAGHSAGGQFVTRYEMANQVHDALGVPVTYVVSNPSSYAYPDPARPAAASEFRNFSDARNCTTYDRWPYGLQNRTGYAAQLSDDQLRKQLAARPVTYLLGPGVHASGARPGVWRIRESEIRSPPPHRRGSTLWPQRALYVHRRAGPAHSIP